MDLARASRFAEWALVVAVGLLHVVIFCWSERADQPNFLVTAAHDAQLLSAIVLILAWSALGPGWVWLRGAALPLLVIAWFLPWNTRMIPRETAASFPLAVAASAALIVVALRICRLRVAKAPFAGGRERGAQFSILAMLIATTLIAATVGALESLRSTLSQTDDTEFFLISAIRSTEREGLTLTPQTVRQLVLSIAVAASAIGGIWVVLRPGAVWLRLAALIVSLGVLGVYLPHLSGAGTDSFTAEAVNLSVALAAIALLTGITVLPLRLMDFRMQQRTVGDSLRESQSTHLAPRPGATADPSVLAEPTREAAAPVEGGASSQAKRRLVGRVTALLGLALLLGGIPLANRLTKQHDVLQPPSTAFAEWSNPRRAQLLLLLKDFHFEWGGIRYVPTLHVEPLEEAAFDAPILNEASPPPNESAKGPPDEIQ